MFKHEQDKLCVAEFERFRTIIDAIAHDVETAVGIGHTTSQTVADCDARIRHLSEDLAVVEQKLDELLKTQDASARSIPGEEPKPEAPNVMPGHIPWSQRKRHREQASRSPNFIDKVKKGAATTEKTEEVKNE